MGSTAVILAAAASVAAASLFAGAARAEPPQLTLPGVGEARVHENLAVYFLRGPSVPGPVPLTLAEALEKGRIELRETGNVRELQISNNGDEPVFVQLGDIVKGGRQDRVLGASLLLKPHSGIVPIGAYCVERGRWSPRGREDAGHFALSEALLPSREAKVAIAKPAAPAAPNVATGGRRVLPIEVELNRRQQRQQVTQDQGVASLPGAARTGAVRSDPQSEVWRNVDLVQKRLSDNLATAVASDRSRTSLQLALENERLKSAQQVYIQALESDGLKDSDIIGVAIAIDGRLASAELYPSAGLFRKMWPKIVRAAATEAIALQKKAAAPAAAPSVETVKAFLVSAEAGRASVRQLDGLASVETREAADVLSVSASSPTGAFVHRSYIAH